MVAGFLRAPLVISMVMGKTCLALVRAEDLGV